MKVYDYPVDDIVDIATLIIKSISIYLSQDHNGVEKALTDDSHVNCDIKVYWLVDLGDTDFSDNEDDKEHVNEEDRDVHACYDLVLEVFLLPIITALQQPEHYYN